MPKAAAKKKPTPPVAPTAPEPLAIAAPLVATVSPAVNEAGGPLPILYDKLEIKEYSTASERGPLNPEDWKIILGWETEKQYLERKVKEEPNTKPEAWMVNPAKKDVFGDIFHCRNVAGEKVRCNNNAHNRPFDENWCESHVHTILYGQWAGPFTIPGETVNGETVRVSKYGRVLSGQHQGTGCILADEFLQKARKELGRPVADEKYPTWAMQDHCFIETIVITGMSEDPRVLMTIDYVKPRTAADVFYTSAVFRDSTSVDRKDLCKMLASAVDFLWTRTDARGYRTHPEVVGFLDRHKKLLDSVLLLYKENSAATGRKISKIRLQPGQCAAMKYLMGCSGPDTDSDSYRNETPPTEKNLDWSLGDHASDFWSYLAGSNDFLPVRQALGRLLDSTPNGDNEGQGGRLPEKLAILAKAWEVWRDYEMNGPPFTDFDLTEDGVLALSYTDVDDKGNALPDGQIKLLDIADFGGIDCPEVITSTKAGQAKSAEPPPPTREEIERASQEALARRATAR